MSGERPGLEKLESAAAEHSEALGDRRISMTHGRKSDSRPFLQGGRDAARLITTRKVILPANVDAQDVAMAAGVFTSISDLFGATFA